MTTVMTGFAVYELMNVETGTCLYKTCATETEIVQANSNLSRTTLSYRYYKEGTFHVPTLHY